MSTHQEKNELSLAFGSAVRTFREQSGVSQERFALKSGIDRAYYGLIERGRKNPTIRTVWIIAEALGRSPEELIAATREKLRDLPGAER